MPRNHSAKSLAIAFCAFAAVFNISQSQATEINVPDPVNDIFTIQDGIDVAFDGDEIIVADGNYFGEGNNNIHFSGKAITVRSAEGSANCIINLAGTTRSGFNFTSSEDSDSVLQGFTITNGNPSIGSVVFVSFSSPTITGNLFINNNGSSGSAILFIHSNSLVFDNTFDSNTSSANGGAIQMQEESNVQLNDNNFFNNSATGLGGAIYVSDSMLDICGGNIHGSNANVGGGLYGLNSVMNVKNISSMNNNAVLFGGAITSDNSDTTVCDSVFNGDTSEAGGGAIATSSGSSIEIKNSRFINCSSGTSKESGSGDGGAMFNFGVPAVIIDCIFEGNSATRGGAIYNQQTNLQSTNCLFFGNTATSTGGAIHNSQSNPQIRLATMWGNIAASGGGIYNTTSSFPNISNSILNHNNPDQIRDIPGSLATVTYSNIQGGWGGDGNINLAPGFIDPSNGDFNLAPGSACIDAGNNALVPGGVKTDLVGNPRFVDDPDTKDTGLGAPPLVDMGALEFQVISPCPWDLNGDGTVNTSDLLALFAQWGTSGSADFDGSGVVNTTDLLILFANWGPCP